MTPEEIKQLIQEELAKFVKTDRFLFEKHIQLLDARHIQLGKNNGTKIGTQTTQKLAFYGVTPIVQQSAITAPSGGATIDSQARTAITSLITTIKNIGITA